MNVLFFFTTWVWFLSLFVNADPPPYYGTSFIDPAIITADDSSALVSVTSLGKGIRKVFDRRIGKSQEMNVFVFKIVWADGLTTEARVNSEFGSTTEARTQAMKYGRVVGQLPTCLRKVLLYLDIHKGNYDFAGGTKSVVIHTERSLEYENDGVLEEILFHEATHTSLDKIHRSTPDWLAAQQGDQVFISTYAQENPQREDVAESFLPWFAVRQCNRRISQENYDKITQAIAQRLEYFDKQGFDLYPLCIE
jgi:hypothetical protein